MFFLTHLLLSDPDIKYKKPSHRVLFPMGWLVGASRNSLIATPWEMLNQIDSVGQSLSIPDTGQDTKRNEAVTQLYRRFHITEVKASKRLALIKQP